MTTNLVQMLITLVLITGLAIAFGPVLARAFTSKHHFLPERLTYRLLGVDPEEEMPWQRYALALVLANGAMMLLGYALLRLQDKLPLNGRGLPALSEHLSFNTAASFITNTNWQSYAGEGTLSNFSQMAVITFLMFVGAATGFAAGGAFIRALSRTEHGRMGSYWVDMTRVIYRVLLPLCFVLALLYVQQGVPQTLSDSADATGLEGQAQTIILGPVASLESIKHIGTNGGGFFNTNSAHPFESPTPLTNMYSILGMMLVTSAFLFVFATMVRRRRQGWLFFGAVSVLFVGFLALAFVAEQTGNPILTAAGVDQTLTAGQSGGNMEGKEVRFGQAQTGLFITATTAATTGTVDAMHDSLTPLGGFVPLGEMMLNSVFGGKGVGFMNIIQNAILAVFIVGLMVGRTPEFLSKKIEAREVKLVMLSVLAHPASILGFTALAIVLPVGLAGLANPGAHGFTEVLYAYTSGTANNGSAFAGLTANTPFYNTTLGLAMLIGRYLSPIVPLLAVGGALAAKRAVPETAGTFNTATPLFGGLLIGVVLIVGGLTFFPALALGPLVEHLQMIAGTIIAP